MSDLYTQSPMEPARAGTDVRDSRFDGLHEEAKAAVGYSANTLRGVRERYRQAYSGALSHWQSLRDELDAVDRAPSDGARARSTAPVDRAADAAEAGADDARRRTLRGDVEMLAVDLGDHQAELAKLDLAERTLERTWLFLERGDATLLSEVDAPSGPDNVQMRTAQWKAAGVTVLPGGALPAGGTRLDQAFVETPDGVRMEILEDKTQTVPIRNEHIHFALPAAEIPKAQAWYAKVFGGEVATRNNAPVVNLPGVQLRFNTADAKQAPTRGRVFDHFGFDVKDHASFVKRLEAQGITLDQPVGKGATGNTITYITDPWGTRIEIVQRLPIGPQIQ